MNDEVFAQLVAEDVKNKVTDSQRDYLMLPHNRERWKRALLVLSENLDNQIDNINYDKQRDVERYVALSCQEQKKPFPKTCQALNSIMDMYLHKNTIHHKVCAG